MPQTAFKWNPEGVKRLSFRKFQLFPISPQKQLGAGLIAMLLIILGSLVRLVLPIPNINLLVYVVIGYFLSDRIHPNPLVGPAAVAFSIVGLSWTVVIAVPDYFALPPTFMLTVAGNLFLSMAVGALLAAFCKPAAPAAAVPVAPKRAKKAKKEKN